MELGYNYYPFKHNDTMNNVQFYFQRKHYHFNKFQHVQ
jgi:hypothetical protein